MNIISFDIDGTIMPIGMDHFPERMNEIINTIVDRGDVVIFNSGRPLNIMKKFTKYIHKGHVFYSCCNGGAIYDQNDKLYFERFLPIELFKNTYLANKDIKLLGYDSIDKIYYFNHHEFADLEARLNEQDKVQLSIDGKQIDNLVKLIFCADKDVIDTLNINYDKDKYALFKTNPYMLEMMPKGVDKVAAIELIKKLFINQFDEVYAFGDSNNDSMSLLRYKSATFANGSKECKAAATYISLEYQDKGLEDALKHFKLI